MSSPVRVAAFFLLAVAAAAGGFLAYHWHLNEPAPVVDAPAIQTPEMSRPLPELALPDLQGRPHQLLEWRGRPLLVNFWATWCEPCRREIPLLKKLRRAHAAEGLEIIGIAIDFKDAVAAYARKAGIDYPILLAEQDALAPQAFGVGAGLPTTLLASRDGRIVALHIGQLHEESAEAWLGTVLKTP